MVIDEPGKRNRKVRIDKPTETTSGGKTTTTWATYAYAWVSITPLSGREYWEAKQQAASITHRITGTYVDFRLVTADFRLVYGTRTFHILEPPRNLEEANVLMEMMVEEEVR